MSNEEKGPLVGCLGDLFGDEKNDLVMWGLFHTPL